MVEELKLAIKVDDDSIEQSLLKQFANAQKMADKVVLDFKNVNFDDKEIEAKFKALQKKAGQNPIDLSISKDSIQMLSQISDKLGDIFKIAQGKSIIDSSSIVGDIGKIENAVSDMNKAFDTTNVGGLKSQQDQIKKNIDSLEKLLGLLYDVKNVNKSFYSGKHNTDWIGYYSSQEEAISSEINDKKNKLNSSLNLILNEDKNAIVALETEAEKLKSSLQSIQDLSNRISSNSSITNLGKTTDGSFDYKAYANEYKLIDDRLGELNNEYELTNQQLEEYITLQIKAEKIMEKVMNHSGGVKGSGSKNKAELRTWIEKSFAQDLGFDSNEIYNGLFSNITDALYSSWNGISLFDESGTKRNLREISAELSQYKSKVTGQSGIFAANEDTQKLNDINTILTYIKKNASDIQATDFSKQIKDASEAVDFYNKKISEGSTEDFYVEELKRAQEELDKLLSLQERLNIARNENVVGSDTKQNLTSNLKEQETQALATAEAEKKLAETQNEITSITPSSNDSQIEELKSDITQVKTELGEVKEKISGIDTEGFENIRNDVEKTKESVKELNDELTEMKSNLSSTVQAETNISSENNPKKDAFPNNDDVAASSDSVTNAIKEENNALEQNTQKAKENADAKKKLADTDKEVSNVNLSKYDTRLESYNKKTAGYDATIKRFEDGGWTSDTYVQRVNAIRKAVEEYQNILNNLKAHPELVTEKELNRLDEQDKLIKENITAIQNMSAAEKGFTLLSGQKAMDKINSILKENSAMSREAKVQIRAWYNEIASGNPKKNLTQILGEVQKIVNAEADAGRAGKSMIDSIKEKAWYGVASAIGTYFGFNDILRYGGEVLKTVRELDTAYTEMRKVTDESVQSLKNFQKESFSTADSVGTTALALQDATATWMRLGESLDQAKESAKDATVLLNVSEFENIDEATDSLVAMSQAYKELDKMEIIDVLDKIGNEYSISTDQLSTALKDSAAVLKTQGNDLAESVALITAGNAITQDASKTAGETLPEKYRNIFYRTYLTARAA